MTAKEQQENIIKTYLKPILKENGFKTNGNNWWKDKGNFYTVINLQNFSFNSKDNVDFCFNIGIALEKFVADKTYKKITGFDIAIPLREQSFLPKNRETHKFRTNLGFQITDTTNIDKFLIEFKIDFEEHILPLLDNFDSIEKCIDFYDKIPLWKDTFRKLSERNI